VKRLLPGLHLMRWVCALVAIVVSGLLGHHFGVKHERETIVVELQEQQDKLAAVERQYQAQLAQLRTQRDIADTSNLSLQQTLKQLQAESLELESRQRLYENIEGKDRSSGLGVDTVTRINDENGEPKALRITVVQARGRNRVKGQMVVALVGEKSGEPWREVLVDAAGKSTSRFDMRFYQTLVVPLPEHQNHIDIVEINIKPDDKLHKPVSFATQWSGILED